MYSSMVIPFLVAFNLVGADTVGDGCTSDAACACVGADRDASCCWRFALGGQTRPDRSRGTLRSAVDSWGSVWRTADARSRRVGCSPCGWR